MRVFTDPQAFQAACLEARRQGELGFVPTMGALHAGHAALIEAATRHRHAALSIFVNPSQFGPHEDLSRYPRPLEADLEVARRLGVELVFTPRPEDVYPAGFQTWIEPGPLAQELEGAVRPGHFKGVATVVLKLLNLAQPSHAYFGQKDYQQLALVQRLAQDLSLPTQIVGLPTVREPDGLALSSRNVYLSAADRRRALALPSALNAAFSAFQKGERRSATLEALALDLLKAQVDGVDYATVRDAQTLAPVATATPGAAVLLVAARLGKTRLLDNRRFDL